MDKGDYGQVLGIEQPGQSFSDNSRGTRSSMKINKGAWCQRVSSISIYRSGGGGYFEFGYVIGYSTCSGYTGTFRSKPTLFYWSVTNAGRVRCKVWGQKHPIPGQYDRFQVSDVNANTYWGSYWKGNALQPNGVSMDFADGLNLINMERGHIKDSGNARFNSLTEYHDGNGWSRFDNLRRDSDSDPDYHLDVVDEHTGRMIE